MVKKITHRKIAGVLAVIIIASLLLSSTFSWSAGMNQINEFRGESQSCTVTLLKYEKDFNGNLTDVPVKGAQFYLFKENEDGGATQIQECFITDSNGNITLYGLSEGNYYFLENNPTYDYTFDKDDSGKDITKYLFSINKEDLKKGEAIEVKAYNQKRYADLEIIKNVGNGSGTALTQGREDLLFEFTVTFGNDGIYECSIDGGEGQEVPSGGTIKLKHGQTATIKNLPVGVQYTVTETPVAGYTIRSTNSSGNIPVEGAKAEFENIYDEFIDGSLEISKQTYGDENKQFDFTVTFDDNNTYTYTINGGLEQPLSSGDKLILKHGETAVFAGLPAGLGYTVVEDDYTADNYTAGVKEVKGNIAAGGVSQAAFHNYEDDTFEGIGNLEISKTVFGDGTDTIQEFEFTVTFSDGGTYTCKINGGEKEPFASGGKLALKHGETAVFNDIPAGITYTVTEDAADGYTASVKEVSGSIPANGTVRTTFHNYNNHKDQETTLTVKKVVWGEIPQEDKDKEFSFIVIIKGESTEFTLKCDEEKSFTLPAGASYEVLETDYFADGYMLSSITNGNGTAAEESIECIAANTFVGTVYIEISGEKKWNMSSDLSASKPESIIVYLKNGDMTVETATVKPDENGDWKYTFTAPKYDKDGNEIEYTVAEEPIDGFAGTVMGTDILNTYIKPAIYNPTVKKTVTGDKPDTDSVFIFELTAKDNAPMPDSNTAQITGEGEQGFENITFTKAGIYIYSITEIKGSTDGYTYDGSTFTLTVVVEESNGKLFVKSAEYTKDGDGDIYDKAAFNNTYKETGLTSVKVTKIWAGSNPDQPADVKVQLYKNGTAYGDPVTLSASNNWTYIWTGLDKNATWTVDEPNVPEGYKKTVVNTIKGEFTITNEIDSHDDPNEQVTVSGIKVWQHGLNQKSNQPTSIKINVKRGDTVVAQATVTEADHWYWSFYLPKYSSDGKEIQYTIEEEPVTGYTAKYDGYNVTNIHETYDSTTISGQKTWNHSSNTSKQPDSIIVYVMNGDKMVAAKKVTAADGWEFSFDLPKYDENGNEIQYIVDEENVPYYTHMVNGYNITNTFKSYDYPGDSPKTGDSSNLWLWFTFIIASISTLVVLFVFGRKSIHNGK